MFAALIIITLFIIFFDIVLTITGTLLSIAGFIGLVWLFKEVLHLSY